MPGEVAGFYAAWKRYGRVDWGLLFQPTISLCEQGFKVERNLAEIIQEKETYIRDDEALRYAASAGNLDVNI